LSSRTDLEKDIHDFALKVFRETGDMIRKSAFLTDNIGPQALANQVYKRVENDWLRICQNAELSKHLNRVISLEHSGSMPVGDKWVLGVRLIEDILSGWSRETLRLILAIDMDFPKNFAEFFYEDKVQLTTRAPIYGVYIISNESITLEQGVELVPDHLLRNEFDFLTAHLSDGHAPTLGALFKHGWFEKKSFVDPDKAPHTFGSSEEDELFYKMVLVLRLCGMSSFGAPYVKSGLLAPGFWFGYRQYRSILSPASRCCFSVDKIGDRETKGIVEAWKALRDLIPYPENNKTGWISIALRKLNSACERDNSTDRLLDLCVCLEALLTRERQQVTYQFRQRGTLLLSLGCRYLCESQLLEAKRFLSDAYDLRSALVHGNVSDVDKIEPTNTKLFELSRIFSLESIALSHVFSKDEIINKIDLAMASPAAREDLEAMLDNSPLAPFWNQPYEKVSGLFPPEPASPKEQESS
jgi:hypothetical protein